MKCKSPSSIPKNQKKTHKNTKWNEQKNKWSTQRLLDDNPKSPVIPNKINYESRNEGSLKKIYDLYVQHSIDENNPNLGKKTKKKSKHA